MRIFWKHIFRSIKRSPLQSLLIVITVIVATASFVISVKSFFKIRENLTVAEGVDNYVSDITVALSSKSGLRILFEDDLREVVGDSGQVLGEFALEGVCSRDGDREFVKFCAVDFEKADDFYKFKFTDYGSFTSENYKRSIIISKDFAENYGLAVGENFSFVLLNQTFEFTVEAIALSEGVLHDCGGVFSIDAVREELAKSNPVINSFSEDFVPYSQLRVRVNDKNKIDSVFERISADERFADKRVFKNAEDFRKFDFYTTVSLVITVVASALVVVLSSIVTSGSMELIRKRRRSDTALFALCGAERRHLNCIVCLESLLYSILGMLGGVPLARLLFKYVNNSLRITENGIKKGDFDWVIAAIASVAVMTVSTFIHLWRERRKTSYELINENETKSGNRENLVLICSFSVLLAALLITVAILPVNLRMAPALAAMFAFLLWYFLSEPYLSKWISHLAVCVFAKFKRVSSLAFMSFKNISSSYPLRHTGRLVSLLLVILSTIFFSISAVDSQIDMVENIFRCDYVAIGADVGCDEILEADACVEDSYRVKMLEDVVSEHGTGVICISAEDDAVSYLNSELEITELPRGAEAFVSRGVAKLCGVGVGDGIVLVVEGEAHSFTVARILDVQSNFAFIDAEHAGYQNDQLAVVISEGCAKEEQVSALSSLLHPRGAEFIEFDSMMLENTEFTKSILGYMEFIVLIAIITTFIGVLNLVMSAHNSRGQEFSVLYFSGFTRGKILLLELCELVAVILLAIILAIPAGYAFSAIFDLSLNSFGADFLH